MNFKKIALLALLVSALAFATDASTAKTSPAAPAKKEEVAPAKVEAEPAEEIAPKEEEVAAPVDTTIEVLEAKPVEEAPIDTSKEVLEAKPIEEAPVDSAALAKAEAEKLAIEKEAQAKADSVAAVEKSLEEPLVPTAKTTILENPWEFLIVSAAFIASVLLIIFTGKD